MIIKNIEAWHLMMPLSRPIQDARDDITHRSCVLVKVETEDGQEGWGECASFAGAGELVLSCVDFMKSRYIGRSALRPAQLFDEQYKTTQHFGRRGVVLNVLSGIDIALWDLVGKRANLPVNVLLGSVRETLNGYFNAGYYVEDHREFLKESLNGCVMRGTKAVKIKIGRYGYDDDVWRIKTGREILGSSRDLMVDANACLTPYQLQQLDPVMLETRCRWIEEPVPLQSLKALKRLRSSLKTPIAGYELEMTLNGYAELIRAGTIDIVQPDVIWSGGITDCSRIASICAAENLEYIPHNFASVISLAANAQVCAVAPTGGWLEVDYNDNPFLWELDDFNDWKFEDGVIKLSKQPGIGVSPSMAFIKEYEVKL